MKHELKYAVVFWITSIIAATIMSFSLVPKANAANCSTYPYTLTNGQTADATQVMANFNSILSCANANLAHNAANSDISSLSGLATPLSTGQGGTGLTTGVPFDFYVFVGGLTGNNWTLANYQPSTALVLRTASSRCVAGVAATGSTTYTLLQNGASIGTAVVGAGGTSCTATITSSPASIAAGDILSVVGPATGDATVQNVGMTFGGSRN